MAALSDGRDMVAVRRLGGILCRVGVVSGFCCGDGAGGRGGAGARVMALARKGAHGGVEDVGFVVEGVGTLFVRGG